jgi:hypothetical protein
LQQIISIKDKYYSQRVALLQNYLPKIKAITTTVDYNVSKLNYGDAVKTPQLKKMYSVRNLRRSQMRLL